MPDLYQTVTNKIISQLERTDLGQWTTPWHRNSEMPRSGDGRPYRGVNILVLWSAAIERNYTSPVWATYKQWAKHKCQVRRGERAEMVVFYKKMLSYNIDTQKDEERLMARAFFVFNSEQVDGYQEPVPQALDITERVIQAEDYFHNITDAEVRHGGNRAYYSPTHDFISLPEYASFKDAHSYYSTLGHEHIHWTGHDSRLHRNLESSRFGDEAYAFEELIAELGAAFLCAQLGLANEPRLDHAQYLASWLSVMHSDKKAIFTAASKAQKAVAFLYGEKEEVEEPATDTAIDQGRRITQRTPGSNARWNAAGRFQALHRQPRRYYDEDTRTTERLGIAVLWLHPGGIAGRHQCAV